MTMTKYNKPDGNRVDFRVLDSDSPVRVREITGELDLNHTLVILASKSGSTIEPRLLLRAVRAILAEAMPEEEVPKHLVAITDPGSAVEKQARKEGWLAIFNGEPTVGGRFSALSNFGLVPAALAGIDIKQFVARALEAVEACSQDAIDNPAIDLAAFLFDNYVDSRDVFSFYAPKRGRVLGLWIEQLVAESTGKQGQGILPSVEVDSLLLTHDPRDRALVTYQTKPENWDEGRNFEMSLACIDPSIPRKHYKLDSVYDLAEHFVLWEYAIAMTGYLMQVCPFDQPDVASAKAVVLDILRDGLPAPDGVEEFYEDVYMGSVEVRLSPELDDAEDLHDALCMLFEAVEHGDYFALNAFLPFTGEGRKEALESIRHTVSEALGIPASLEIGPRYLHSTGQLQKGGPNNGVFLLLSADEMKDIPLKEEAASLGALAKAQAVGDFVTLADRGRRCMHLHLPDNSGVMLRYLAQVIGDVVSEVVTTRFYEGVIGELVDEIGDPTDDDLYTLDDDFADFEEELADFEDDMEAELDTELMEADQETEIELEDINEFEDELSDEYENKIDEDMKI